MPPPKKKNPGGRKPGFAKVPTPEQISLIHAYSKIRLSVDEIAILCDTSKDTLERWMKKYPEVNAAIKKGRVESKAHAVNNAYLRAFPISKPLLDENGKVIYDNNGNIVKESPKGDSVLAIFLLKTMFGFKEPDKKIKISGNKGDTEIVFNLGGKNLTQQEVVENHKKYYDEK